MRFRRLKIYFLTRCLAMKGVNHLSFSLRTHNTYIVQKTWIRACKRLLVTEHSWKSRVYEFSSKHMCTLLYFIRLHSSIAKQSAPLNENRIFSLNSEPFLLWATPFIYFRQLVISCLKSSRRDCLGRAQIFHGAPFLRLWEFPMIGCFDVFLWVYKTNKKIEDENIAHQWEWSSRKLHQLAKFPATRWNMVGQERLGILFPSPFAQTRRKRGVQGVERYFWDLRLQPDI